MASERIQLTGKVVARLSLYRRVLTDPSEPARSQIYSHELAKLAGVSSAQVRRDIMTISYSGTPNRGYEVKKLVDALATTLDHPTGSIALVGVGNLGRAIIAFFAGGRHSLTIAAAFDSDPEKDGRLFFGCRCYSMDKLAEVVAAKAIKCAVLTVPAPDAQRVTDQLVEVGISGILNFAAVPLRVPPHIYLHNQDMTMALETVAFFARRGRR
jgi:redox-sensing transcriptional repressor